jgi:hypothetical protein
MITLNEMNLEDMRRAERDGYLCAECQGRLSVAWKENWILRCVNDINHHGITRHDIKYENKIKEHLSMESTALTTMPEAKMIERVNMARFPQELTVPEKKLLAQVAITYGFDPLMGEVTIYQGKPFVSIDGRYRKAQETGMLDGVESRPASKQDRADWNIPEGDYFFRADVWLKGSSRPCVGWGRVFMAETQGGKGFKPVEKNPQRMAEKRAEAQALRKAFHINLPSYEDIGSLDYEPEPIKVVEVKSEEKRSTFEANEQPPEAKEAPLTEAKGASIQVVYKRDPASLKSLPEAIRACYEDYGKQPKDVLAIMGVKTQIQISDSPADVYRKVAEKGA